MGADRRRGFVARAKGVLKPLATSRRGRLVFARTPDSLDRLAPFVRLERDRGAPRFERRSGDFNERMRDLNKQIGANI